MGNVLYFLSYFLQIVVLSVFWCYGIKRRKLFVLRLFACFAVFVGIIFLVGVFEAFSPDTNPIIFSMPYVLIMALFGVMFGLCFDVPADTVLLLLLLPTTAQLCGDAIGTILSYCIKLPCGMFYVYDIISTACMCVVSLLLSRLFRKIFFYDAGLYRVILTSSYFVVVCIFVLNGFRVSIDDEFTRRVIVPGYRLLMSVFVYFLIFSMLFLGRMRYQKSMTEVLLKKEEEQHSLTRELTELINIKYHDIKHIKNSGAAPEFFERDGKLLDIYGLLVDCGNEALNTILTEKNVTCNNGKIDLSLMVDGKLLEFMLPVDIYVLFGNALDNAIECLAVLPENERHIKLSVRSVRDMVSIDCENTCHNKPKFENGLPQTTKDDGCNHGFGTKSIADVCKKYKAQYRMTCDGERFVLSILMPAQKTA